MALKGSEKLPKTARLRKRPEFLSLSRTGKKIHSANFVFISKKNDMSESRLGITVSGKVGNAVVRNRIKRLVREHFRRHRNEIAAGTDVLVIARPSAIRLSAPLLFEEVGRVLCQGRSGRR